MYVCAVCGATHRVLNKGGGGGGGVKGLVPMAQRVAQLSKVGTRKERLAGSLIPFFLVAPRVEKALTQETRVARGDEGGRGVLQKLN